MGCCRERKKTNIYNTIKLKKINDYREIARKLGIREMETKDIIKELNKEGLLSELRQYGIE